ncbi:class D sortase [Alkalicoccobacillus gibsonii]|uniref:class D sortase n=1 Tax=Alkalicoccobacillus gibsonii TaxID=79881 RepID=UPI00351672B1
MKRLRVVYSALIIIGLTMTGYFGFQWINGTQAAESVSQEELKQIEDAKTVTVENEVTETEEEPTTDPIMSDEIELFDVGSEMSRLIIPKIEKSYKTYWGADDATLKQGVGMYVSQWTTTPDEKRHTVLSGHRDTVFSELGSLNEGDVLYLEYEEQRYEYEISEIWITDADDRTVIVDKDAATLTLTTCYPFEFLGSAPDRYIIQSKLIGQTAL